MNESEYIYIYRMYLGSTGSPPLTSDSSSHITSPSGKIRVASSTKSTSRLKVNKTKRLKSISDNSNIDQSP